MYEALIMLLVIFGLVAAMLVLALGIVAILKWSERP